MLIKPVMLLCCAIQINESPRGSRADQNAYGPTMMVSRSTELER